MTKARIHRIAAKLWAHWTKLPVANFATRATPDAQAAWIGVARVAVAELHRDPCGADKRGSLGTLSRKLKAKVCRLGPGGKHVCK